MKAKKCMALCGVLGILSFVAAGCGIGAQTEEEIVYPKGEKAQEEGTGTEMEEGQAEGREGIARQVQAPERYLWEGSAENVSVKVDAPVIVPQGEGFQTYKVTSRLFSQEDYDRVNQALLEGTPLKSVEVNIAYEENREVNFWTGSATVKGRSYSVEVNNDLREDWKWRWVNIDVRSLNYDSAFFRLSADAGAELEEISGEEVTERAKETAAEMGFAEFIPGGGEYFWLPLWGEKKERTDGEKGRYGYGVHFTRTIDKIPVTYTYLNGSLLEEADSVAWPYETLDFIYDKEGLVYFSWNNPYELERLSEEYVFLLPFSEIQNVFEEMMLKKYGDFFADADAEAEFRIKEVRLGYMRVMEKGNPQEGKMIPVWDFFGSERIYYAELENPYVEEGLYYSWLTINAMDGTIIDRGFGY